MPVLCRRCMIVMAAPLKPCARKSTPGFNGEDICYLPGHYALACSCCVDVATGNNRPLQIIDFFNRTSLIIPADRTV
ncbi:hypothetical protein D3C72_2226760 [compost metagenome]